MKKDFLLTFLAQMIILASGLAVFKLAIEQFGENGFAEFSIMKRNSTYLYSLITLGLSVAIPKFIALERGAKSGNEHNIFLASFIVLLSSLFISGIFFWLFKNDIAYLLFGDAGFSYLLFPLFVSLVGLSLSTMVYAYYRGQMFFNLSNILQIMNLGVIPLGVFLFAKNIEEIFLFTGLLMSALSLIVLTKIFFSQAYQFDQIRASIPKIFSFGGQRVPADFGLASLIALPAIFAAHSDGMLIAGYVAFSVSLLSLGGQLVAPVGLVMLPKISHLLGEKNYPLIRHYIQKLLLFSLAIALLGTILYQLFADTLLSLYLGGGITSDLVAISKQILWGMLFYPIYVTMRSVIDAYYTHAYNSLSIFASLILFVTIYLMGAKVYFALNAALALLALLTLFFIRPLLLRAKI